jgi:serine/threonine-protein kinase PknG
MNRNTLSSQILSTALVLLTSRQLKADPSVRVFGAPLQETQVRFGLEKSFRTMAQMMTGEARINMVDRANAVRPRTLF